jgi:hypothetical protein
VFDHPFLQSSGLIGQSEQANVTDSDRGPVLEPIQEAFAHDRFLGDLQQGVGDQSQLLISEAPESSSTENTIA